MWDNNQIDAINDQNGLNLLNSTTSEDYHDLEVSRIHVVERGGPRFIVELLVDDTRSMAGAALIATNKSLHDFKDVMTNQVETAALIDLVVIPFAEEPRPTAFIPGDLWEPIELQAKGRQTKIALAIQRGLDEIEKQKTLLRSESIEYYRPVLVLLTDGQPNSETPGEIEAAIDRVHDYEARRKVTLFPVGVGDAADMRFLTRLSPRAQKLEVADLRKFFQTVAQDSIASATAGAHV